ncbi:MFS transporter [Entomospira entomophila]|uniref:MFS transporter n=1 Tax=Entomospira entomophila TaxID=2719988 RepID=A0A968G9U4_9SPIO|nr:MFS transporter [Entomospira entomophilus]NIZ40671.1 MFS transporter [Entomospira entomophilus]WDI34885.1 MFS transporter [Entomospira entomophilus]
MDKKYGRYTQLLLLALSAGAIFRLVYLRASFQEGMQQAWSISVVQLNQLYVLLGIATIGYLPSGWIADRFSTKNVVITALALTAILSLMLAFNPSFIGLKWIYSGLGITSVVLFWSSHMRIVRMLGGNKEDGKIFGLLDGWRGLSEALFASIATVLFQWRMSQHEQRTGTDGISSGMQIVFIFFAVLLLILSIINIFLLAPDRTQKIRKRKSITSTKNRSYDRSVKDMVLIKQVILISAIIFSGYTLFFTGFAFSSLLTTTFNIPLITAAYVLSGLLWMRPIGAITGGFLADKYPKYIILGISMILSMAGIILLLYLPLPNIIRFMIMIFVSFMNAMIRGVYWSLLHYIHVPEQELGRMIGIISFIGYLPDVILPLLSVHIYRLLPEIEATRLYLQISLFIGGIGLMILFYFYSYVKRVQHTYAEKNP